jgi:hypothetical protein
MSESCSRPVRSRSTMSCVATAAAVNTSTVPARTETFVNS